MCLLCMKFSTLIQSLTLWKCFSMLIIHYAKKVSPLCEFFWMISCDFWKKKKALGGAQWSSLVAEVLILHALGSHMGTDFYPNYSIFLLDPCLCPGRGIEECTGPSGPTFTWKVWRKLLACGFRLAQLKPLWSLEEWTNGCKIFLCLSFFLNLTFQQKNLKKKKLFHMGYIHKIFLLYEISNEIWLLANIFIKFFPFVDYLVSNEGWLLLNMYEVSPFCEFSDV